MLTRRTTSVTQIPGESRLRKGSILVLAAAMMVMIFGFVAFTIDIGYVSLTKAQMQNAVDAAALAGAMELSPGSDQDTVAENVKDAAMEIAMLHAAGEKSTVQLNRNSDILLGRQIWNNGTGSYDYIWGETAKPYNIVKVVSRRTQIETVDENNNPVTVDDRLPLFFAPVIGHNRAGLEVAAIATFQPRDIMLILDYSGSMNDDSEYRHIDTIGRSALIDNMQEMWQDLGSPQYGNMPFEPDWLVASGVPKNSSNNIPHIDVTWKGSSVNIESTYKMYKVRMEYTNGSVRNHYPNSKTGTFSYNGNQVKRVYVRSWGNKNLDPTGNERGERFDFDDNGIIEHLGLNNVNYPYPSGSWNNFVDYVVDSSGSTSWYSRAVYDAGYRKKFGIMSLLNFWNEKKENHQETPDLWKIRQQPISALKDATDILLDYLTEVEAEDLVGFSAYSYGNGAKLESGLTQDYSLIKTLSRQRQAGHYDSYTNIGAGMKTGRLEVEANARQKAMKMMVLMTDGIANRSSTSASPAQSCRDEADLCAAAGIKVMTISLGTGADTNLMQDIADRTGGRHFNVPGGQSVSDYQAELMAVFSEIASSRPLKLIAND